MPVSLFVDNVCGNYVGAVADGNRLLEYRVEKINAAVPIGSVFKGKVENVLGGMQAAFVNVGLPKNGYLSADDMLMDKSEIEGRVELPSVLDLKPGDEIMVQAVKDPAGTKGVRLTRHLSFAGRYVVFLPTLSFAGVSRKITDEKTRERLTKIAEKYRPEGKGIIIRTAGENARKGEIKNEIRYLEDQFKEIEENFAFAKPATCIYEEGNVGIRLLRDVYTKDVDKFVVSDRDLYEKLRVYAKRRDKDLKSKLRFYDKKIDMFRYYGLNANVEGMLSSSVSLENGAYIVIDKTEAMTVIDVNTGKFTGEYNLEETVFKTNMLAAVEIARQLRLRNIAGIIVVDFIDMTSDAHKTALLKKLDDELKSDRERCQVIGMTPLGLVEITRKKRRRESISALVKDCPYCQGTGHIQSNDYIVMRIRTELLDLFANGYNNAKIDLNIEIADYIIAKKALKNDVEKIWTGKRVYLIPHKTYHQQFFIIKGDNSPAMDVPDKAMLLV